MKKHTFLGDYPKDREPGWSADLQGVTHDEANWFISQTKELWNFPPRLRSKLGAGI